MLISKATLSAKARKLGLATTISVLWMAATPAAAELQSARNARQPFKHAATSPTTTGVMHIAPVWPSTVKTSNQQTTSTDPAAMHRSMAAISGTWFAKSCGPLLRERSASLDHGVGHVPWSDIEAYFDRRAKIITRGDRCRPAERPAAPAKLPTSTTVRENRN
jgi:hypothetical protein